MPQKTKTPRLEVMVNQLRTQLEQNEQFYEIQKRELLNVKEELERTRRELQWLRLLAQSLVEIAKR